MRSREVAELADKQRAAPTARISGPLPCCGTLLTAIGIALLPKCPMCFAAYAGVFSYLGLSFAPNLSALHGLLIGSLAISIVCLAVRVVQFRVSERLVIGLCAMGALLVGKYLLEIPLLTYGGLAGLCCFFFWRRRPLTLGRRFWPGQSFARTVIESRLQPSPFESRTAPCPARTR